MLRSWFAKFIIMATVLTVTPATAFPTTTAINPLTEMISQTPGINSNMDNRTLVGVTNTHAGMSNLSRDGRIFHRHFPIITDKTREAIRISSASVECLPGLECVHGICDFSNFACFCDSGWFGPTCDNTCEPACNQPEVCSGADPFNPVCILAPPREGNTSTERVENVTRGHPSSAEPPKEGLWKPLEGYGPLAPLSWRTCDGGPFFECRYGNCTHEDNTISCTCEPNFFDNMCDKPCELDCGEFGQCTVTGNDGKYTQECICFDHRYEGYDCAILVREDKNSGFSMEMKVVIGGAIALVLSFIVPLVVFYMLWRRRNVTMMKIVYWFQAFEEDDDRDCDAFVSYASADFDRQFVVQVLTPRLEGEMCFTLCLHQRDFLPGQYISHNISDSVKRSRRTIIVVSPAYVNSDWCRFEFQMALQEMISQKHRILPILLDDVSSLKKDMDETLKKVLEAVTWIEYPGEGSNEKEIAQFWKRIALSMPKKRTSSPQEGLSMPKKHTTSPEDVPCSVTSPNLSPDLLVPTSSSLSPVQQADASATKQTVKDRSKTFSWRQESSPTSLLSRLCGRSHGRPAQSRVNDGQPERDISLEISDISHSRDVAKLSKDGDSGPTNTLRNPARDKEMCGNRGQTYNTTSEHVCDGSSITTKGDKYVNAKKKGESRL